jgi:hypothetical protein
MTSLEQYGTSVSKGIADLACEFGALEATPTGDGGARVTLARVALPSTLSQSHSWIGFLLPYSYDEVQVYGHFVPAELTYADGRTLQGPGLAIGQTWEGRPAIKISRNSPRWRAGIDSAVTKVIQVVAWLGAT